MYLKVICAFFVTIPLDININTRLPITILQRLSSYAIRCADVIGLILLYSRGFSSCLRGTTVHSTEATLTHAHFEICGCGELYYVYVVGWISLYISLYYIAISRVEITFLVHIVMHRWLVLCYLLMHVLIMTMDWIITSIVCSTLHQYYIKILEFVAVIFAVCAASRMLYSCMDW